MNKTTWMALALLCTTGCGATSEPAPNEAPKVEEVAAAAVHEVVQAVTTPKALKAPLADGVEPGFAYANVMEMTMPATGGGSQRTVKLWVTELTPAEALEKLGAQLTSAGFELTRDGGTNQRQYKRGAQVFNLSTIDFKPGDENGLGLLDVTILTP